MKFVKALIGLVGHLAAALSAEQSDAAQTNVAVAANFTEPVKEIAAAFRHKTAHEALLSFGSSGALYTQITQDVVQSADITQAFQFVDTGNADVRFVAAAQLISRSGSRWVVAQDLYEPIRQGAVLLNKGAGNEAAVAFMQFLTGPEAHAIIEKYGYAFDNSRS